MQLSTRNDKRITINLSKHIFPFLLDPRVSYYSCGARLHLVDVVLNKENNVETFLGWISNYLDSWPVQKLVLHQGENFFTFTLCNLPSPSSQTLLCCLFMFLSCASTIATSDKCSFLNKTENYLLYYLLGSPNLSSG